MTPELSYQGIFQTLSRHGVDYVVIGGLGAILQGVDLPRTLDLDVAASHGKPNLKRLSTALRDMEAKLRIGPADDPEGVEAPIDERLLSSLYVVTMITHFGPFDVLFEPPGMPPYDELKRRAERLQRFGLEIPVASLHDIVSAKRAAGREKDAAHLTILLQHLRGDSTAG